jgi:hypothetical protein
MPVTTAEDRRRLAIEAALEVGRRFGLVRTRPTIIADSNNTLVHLAPAPLVAKVGTSTIRAFDSTTLEREVAVASYLAVRRAPVVHPSDDPPAGPHQSRSGATVSLWRYYEHVEATDVRAAAVTLRALHTTLAGYSGHLPSFTLEFDGISRFLAGRDALSALGEDERGFLLDVKELLRTELAKMGGKDQVLHGAPHFGNLLKTPAGLLWTDFETACRGPLEWDLAGFPSGAEAMFPEADAQRLQTLRLVRSLAVSVKCWAQFGRAPEVDEAARHHLGLLHDWHKRLKGR